jgi:hypothetical protein
MAPTTKYGAITEECHPGTSDIPKSQPTIELTEIMTMTINGVMIRIVVLSNSHSRCVPFHPRQSTA